MGGRDDFPFAIGVALLFCEFLFFLGFYCTFSDFAAEKKYYFQSIVDLKTGHEFSAKQGVEGMGMILISMNPLLTSLVSRILIALDNVISRNVKAYPAIQYYGFLLFILFVFSTEYSVRGMRLQTYAVLLLLTLFYLAKQFANFCKKHHLEGWKTVVSIVLVFLCLCFTNVWFTFKNFQCFDFRENDGNVTYYLFIYLIYLINHFDSPSLAVFFGEMALIHSLFSVNPYAASLLILYYLILDLYFRQENNIDYRYFFIRTLQEEHQKILFLGSDDEKYPRQHTIYEPAPGFWRSFALKIVPIFVIVWMGYFRSSDAAKMANTSCGGIRHWSYLLFMLSLNFVVVSVIAYILYMLSFLAVIAENLTKRR
jgi:hypothetical protein